MVTIRFRHWSRSWNALITWLSRHWSRSCQALITWLSRCWSRGWAVADHAAGRRSFPSPMPSNCFLLQAKYCVWEVLWVISASVWHYLPPERVYFCYWLRTGVSQYIQKMIRGEYSFKSVFKVCQYVTKLLRMSIKCSHLNSFLARVTQLALLIINHQ